MQDLLTFLVENLVKNPSDVQVEEKPGSAGEVVLELSVNPEDMGLVIGKGGKIIKAIRSLVRTKAILDNKRVNLVLLEQN